MKRVALSLLVVAASGAYVWNERGPVAPEDFSGPVEAAAELQTGSINTQGGAVAVARRAEAPPAVAPISEVASAAEAAQPAGDPPSGESTPASDPDNAPWEAEEDAIEKGPPLAAVALDGPQPTQSPAAAEPAVRVDLVALPRPTPPSAIEPDLTDTFHPAAPPLLPAAQEPAPPSPSPAPSPASAAPVILEARLPRPRPEYHAPPPVPVVTPVGMSSVSGARYADGAFTGPSVDAYYGVVQVQAVVRDGQLAEVRFVKHPKSRLASVFINRRAMPRLRREAIRSQDASVDFVSGATLTSEAFVRSLDVALRQART